VLQADHPASQHFPSSLPPSTTTAATQCGRSARLR
jgi:hypothetical protein